MTNILETKASITSQGQITLPVALRARLGITGGSKAKFTYDGKQTVMRAKLPVSGIFGMLRHLGNIYTTIPKRQIAFNALW